jgi:diamine N-acetyltransferase
VLTLRPTTAADLAQVAAMEAAADTGSWLAETGLTWHERALADPDQEHLAAVEPGVLAGFAVLAGLRRDDHVVELRRMVVSAELRGAGRGRELLRAALARAYRTHGASRVWLDVKTDNLRARALYEADGFVVVRTLACALPAADGVPSDLLVLEHRRAL